MTPFLAPYFLFPIPYVLHNNAQDIKLVISLTCIVFFRIAVCWLHNFNLPSFRLLFHSENLTMISSWKITELKAVFIAEVPSKELVCYSNCAVIHLKFSNWISRSAVLTSFVVLPQYIYANVGSNVLINDEKVPKEGFGFFGNL